MPEPLCKGPVVLTSDSLSPRSLQDLPVTGIAPFPSIPSIQLSWLSTPGPATLCTGRGGAGEGLEPMWEQVPTVHVTVCFVILI